MHPCLCRTLRLQAAFEVGGVSRTAFGPGRGQQPRATHGGRVVVGRAPGACRRMREGIGQAAAVPDVAAPTDRDIAQGLPGRPSDECGPCVNGAGQGRRAAGRCPVAWPSGCTCVPLARCARLDPIRPGTSSSGTSIDWLHAREFACHRTTISTPPSPICSSRGHSNSGV